MMEWIEELRRIFLGENSPWFLLEIVFRTTFIFSYTLVLIRWMGKRGMGQLSPFELAIIIALGSAVGDPMIYDDVPLLNSMIAIAVIIGLQQLLGHLTQKNEHVEQWVESRTELLVEKGRIDLVKLAQERLSNNELFEMLRIEGVAHLGQVRQAFIEPSGRLSVIRWTPSRPGLSVMPTSCQERKFCETLASDWLCCVKCGASARAVDEPFRCPYCTASESCTACRDREEEGDAK